jgi:hypothetical protein
MTDRQLLIIELALSMLEHWYTTWIAFGKHSAGEIRGLSLGAKTRGLIIHDRVLLKAEVLLHG